MWRVFGEEAACRGRQSCDALGPLSGVSCALFRSGYPTLGLIVVVLMGNESKRSRELFAKFIVAKTREQR